MANKKIPKVYVDACCFTELATSDRFSTPSDPSTLEDLRYIRALLQAHFSGETEVYTSTLSIAECQYVKDPRDARNRKIFDDEVRALFRSMLMSGKFVFLVQDTVLVAERAVNLRWTHGLAFGGADAAHIASALESDCEEFLTFDKGILKSASDLFRIFGLRATLPRSSLSVPASKSPDADPLFHVLDPLREESDSSVNREEEAERKGNPVAAPEATPMPTAQNISVTDTETAKDSSATSSSSGGKPAESLQQTGAQTNASQTQPNQSSDEPAKE